jgi:hypothetical protein
MDEDQPRGTGRIAMLYDWFKHLTTLSILALGGVLSLSQSGNTDLKTATLVIVVVFIGGAGIAAFTAAEKIMGAVANGDLLPPSVGWLQKGAPALLGMGVGAFLYVFLQSLN